MSVIKGSSRKGNSYNWSMITMYEGKPVIEPIKVKKLGTILHKDGVFIPNSEGSTSGTTPPHDIIEGYVLETAHNIC